MVPIRAVHREAPARNTMIGLVLVTHGRLAVEFRSVMSRPKVEVLAGINLPMLVKLAKVRDECPLQEAVHAAQEAGRKYVTIASRVLNGK